jgi:hypothetical protein
MTGLNRPTLLLRGRWAVEVVVVFIILANLSTVAAATVRVQGNTTAVQIEANQAQVKDVLAALATNFDIQYRSSSDLDDVRNGTYSGSLREVLSRVLDGYNFVFEMSGSKLEIIVLGRRGDHAIPGVVPTIGAAINPATDWRPRR